MGIVKEMWLGEMERGYSSRDGHICARCVNDEWLQQWIADAAERKRCTFCDRRSKTNIAASFDEFTRHVMSGIHFEWNDPDNEGIAYESAEGGYQASISDNSDVLWDLGVSEHGAVNDALISSIHDNGWVPRSFYAGSPSDILRYGWNHFKEVIKHESRYFFLSPDDDGYDFGAEIKPHAMLDAIANIILNLADCKLIKTVSTDTDIIRLRLDKLTRHKDAAAIGTPPSQFATQSNRMSPAGVPMFYGAYDYKTAIAETFDPEVHEGMIISAGTFRPMRELRVLDLANLPGIPSIYDEENNYLIHPLRFLDSFAQDISRPIERDGREHIEYVPTQIVTEYFRRVFKIDGQRIDGISYPSSKAKGKVAFVLFCENQQCIDKEAKGYSNSMLRLMNVRHRKHS